MSEKEKALRGCPFCGGAAYHTGYMGQQGYVVYVACDECSNQTCETDEAYLHQAIAAWNRRHPDENLVRRVVEMAREMHPRTPSGNQYEKHTVETIIEELRGK
jgi:hypothetical protein